MNNINIESVSSTLKFVDSNGDEISSVDGEDTLNISETGDNLSAQDENESLHETEINQNSMIAEKPLATNVKKLTKTSRKRSFCRDSGCNRTASFGPSGSGPIWCGRHKSLDSCNLSNRVCQMEGCQVTANYGFLEERPKFCSTHKEPNMINRNRIKPKRPRNQKRSRDNGSTKSTELQPPKNSEILQPVSRFNNSNLITPTIPIVTRQSARLRTFHQNQSSLQDSRDYMPATSPRFPNESSWPRWRSQASANLCDNCSAIINSDATTPFRTPISNNRFTYKEFADSHNNSQSTSIEALINNDLNRAIREPARRRVRFDELASPNASECTMQESPWNSLVHSDVSNNLLGLAEVAESPGYCQLYLNTTPDRSFSGIDSLLAASAMISTDEDSDLNNYSPKY